MDSISLSMRSPVVDLMGEIGSEFEKYISKKKRHEKENQKISEDISDRDEKSVGDRLFPEYFSENDGKEIFKRDHKNSVLLKYFISDLFDIRATT